MPGAARDIARPVAVVACAEADAPALTAVVRGLVARQMRVELTPVSEDNATALENAVEQYGTSASYVVCHTPSLPDYFAELCVLTIRAGEVPEEQIIAAGFDPDEPDAFASSVFHWARDEALPNLRDVLESTTKGRIPAAPDGPPPAPAANDDSFVDHPLVDPTAAKSSTPPLEAIRQRLDPLLDSHPLVRPAAVFVGAFIGVFAVLYLVGLVG